MSSYSKERIEIADTYRDMIKSGIKIDENSFINWAMCLYNCSYADAKNGLNDGINLLAREQQAEMSQDVDKDQVLNNVVNNIDSKLEPEQEKILEVFSDGKEI